MNSKLVETAIDCKKKMQSIVYRALIPSPCQKTSSKIDAELSCLLPRCLEFSLEKPLQIYGLLERITEIDLQQVGDSLGRCGP